MQELGGDGGQQWVADQPAIEARLVAGGPLEGEGHHHPAPGLALERGDGRRRMMVARGLTGDEHQAGLLQPRTFLRCSAICFLISKPKARASRPSWPLTTGRFLCLIASRKEPSSSLSCSSSL